MGFKAAFGLLSTLAAQILTRTGLSPVSDREGASYIVLRSSLLLPGYHVSL